MKPALELAGRVGGARGRDAARREEEGAEAKGEGSVRAVEVLGEGLCEPPQRPRAISPASPKAPMRFIWMWAA